MARFFYRKTITVDKNDLNSSPASNEWNAIADFSLRTSLFLMLEIAQKSDFFGIFGESKRNN